MVLRHGRKVEEGDAGQILGDPRMDYTRALVSAREARTDGAQRKGTRRDIILKLSGVTASYARHARVIDDISLTVRRGETVAVVGESGSGKSTLARVIAGLLPREKGDIEFRGTSLPPDLASRDRSSQLQWIYHYPDVAGTRTRRLVEIIGRPVHFYLGLTGSALKNRVKSLLLDMDLPVEFVSRYPGQLSGGEKQRVCIARALSAKPDLIICDEATSALDPLIAKSILELLERLQAERGYAYLLVTHDLGVVRSVADRVAVMLKGRFVAEGPSEQVFAPPYHPYTELLLSSVPKMATNWLDEVLAVRARSDGLPMLHSFPRVGSIWILFAAAITRVFNFSATLNSRPCCSPRAWGAPFYATGTSEPILLAKGQETSISSPMNS